MKKTKQHGGKRKGAGRPSLTDEGPLVLLAVKVKPSNRAKVERIAGETGESLSRVVDRALDGLAD